MPEWPAVIELNATVLGDSMGKFTTANQRGFTLIEMSIVLVIIGLIVGGILKGQELIESARQKNAINQIDQIKSGVTTFIDRFKGYPGDYSRASVAISTLLADGNDNGQVGTARANRAALVTLANATGNGETVQFWNHLLAANAIGGGSVIPSGTNPGSFSGLGSAPSPLPAAAFPQSGLSVTYGTDEGSSSTSGTSKEGHWLILHRWIANGNLASGNSAISPVRTFQLDNKYDDGLPNSGNIRSINGTGNCGAGGNEAYATLTSPECLVTFLLE